MFAMYMKSGRFSRLAALLLFAATHQAAAAEPPQAGRQPSAGRGITVDDLVTMEDILAMSVSPDGGWVAFQTLTRRPETNSFTVAWYIAPAVAGATPQRVASGTEPEMSDTVGQFIASSIVWAPDNRTIFFTRKQDGAVQIWRAALGSDLAERVSSSEGDVVNLRMSGDGRRLVFAIGRPRSEIRRIDEEVRRNGFVQEDNAPYIMGFGVRVTPCTDGNPDRLLLGSSRFACVLTSWTYDLAGHQIRRAEAAEVSTSPDDSVRSMMQQGGALSVSGRLMSTAAPDGRVAWIENADPQRYRGTKPIMVLGVTTDGRDFRCPLSQCRNQRIVGFRNLWWHGAEIVFHVHDGSHSQYSSVYAWNPRSGRLRTLLRSEDLIGGCQMGGHRLVCTSEGSTSPGAIIAIDIGTGRRTTLVDVNPRFHEIGFTPVELILGQDDKGDPVSAHLVYPRNYRPGQRYPLVVTQYTSSGFLRGATGDEQPIHVYADNGIAVLSFDHQVSSGRLNTETPFSAILPIHYRNMNIEQYQARAVERMVDGLVSRGIVDPARVGISGLSFGDQVLATALLRRTYVAASSSALTSMPILPLPPAIDPWNGVLESALTPAGREARARYSFAASAARVRTPLLLQTADVEFRAAEDTYNALRAAGTPVELYQYPDERHVKWQPAHNLLVYRRNLDWFRFWLLGQEDNDPAKAAQYERWRAMREAQCRRLTGADAPWYCAANGVRPALPRTPTGQ